MSLNRLAGKPVKPSMLVNIPRLITAYYSRIPDYSETDERVVFGTSGHRGSSFENTFNEWHILAISQAICLYRREHNIDGPIFIGIDTHALSEPAFVTVLEVTSANGMDVMIAGNGEYTPTPAVSHAILKYNRSRKNGLADGIIITPSHNPPDDGGLKYNPPNGGPSGTEITKWIEAKANKILENGLEGVKRIPFEQALRANTIHGYDFMDEYVKDLGSVVDMNAIRNSKISLGVDPLGGAGIRYWSEIADRYGLNLKVTNKTLDPAFGFMTLDWDGRVRMDPSSPYAMKRLIKLKDRFEIAFACDTDHDRHGIVTRSAGLMPPNDYLSAAIFYLFNHRPDWRREVSIGKTVASSLMIDRVAAKLGRGLYEVPVGFKWFADGLFDGSLGFVGEESAGASFLRFDGTVWTTEKDGIISALLSAEITANSGRDPGEIYRKLTSELGRPVYERIDAPATLEQKEVLGKLSPDQVRTPDLAGDKIQSIITRASGNGAPIGGLKIVTENGWFAARPSGTESIYKIYAESFLGQDHLRRIQEEAQEIVDRALREVKVSGVL